MVTDTTAAVHCEGGGGAEDDDIHLVYCTRVHVQSGASGTSECAPPKKQTSIRANVNLAAMLLAKGRWQV